MSDVLADAVARAAIEKSVFGALPTPSLRRLVTDASLLDIPAGAVFIRHGTTPPTVHLLVRGLGRTFLASPTGRQATIRYIREGEVVGSASLFLAEPMPVGSQVIVDSTLLRLSAKIVREIVATDVHVANAFNREMALRLSAYFRELEETTFGSVRQRLVRHLLHVAGERQRGADLVVQMSQQQLADAVGSVREVVARIVGDLRRDGLLRTVDDGIVITDPTRLEAEGWSAE